MSIKLSMPQRALLDELKRAGEKGVFKSVSYGPASVLVSVGHAKWARKFDNGNTGTLVITPRGINFLNGVL
ncbi:hypothetical protein [Sinorhizobium meliloti]|uniref:hypothetical protein n=1 Tax=Rhizobium meliloti TaxID=382 RepID=UPI0001E4AB54|nr:hypothetical protein [Sinorhizobium meliloti]AEG53137.1 hypothetical protein Sinme_1390 [Sinorhizobium meliloti AK83]MDE4591148.1 hypothetical protein [Sinorhizobium meliloti]SEI55877.1 hypothetical protein SAMN04244575_01038 [Sinorhizobium meliloti]